MKTFESISRIVAIGTVVGLLAAQVRAGGSEAVKAKAEADFQSLPGIGRVAPAAKPPAGKATRPVPGRKLSITLRTEGGPYITDDSAQSAMDARIRSLQGIGYEVLDCGITYKHVDGRRGYYYFIKYRELH